jgi:hypothetical protein
MILFFRSLKIEAAPVFMTGFFILQPKFAIAILQ